VTADDVRAAYDAAGAAWAGGPERVYGVLAGLLLDVLPGLDGARLLDAGAGTGAISREARARGAWVVAVDVAEAMLRHARETRPPAVAGSVLRLPLKDGTFDVAAAAFCLNHLPDPVTALRELCRVVRPGGAVVGSVFATGNDHPAKALVEARLVAAGWRRPPWYAALKDEIEPLLAEPDAFAAVAEAAGLSHVTATVVVAEHGLDDPADIVEWRLGMAHTAPFVAALPAETRARLRADLVADVRAVGQAFRPRVVVLSSRRAA
jgi:ubiquinone/menaquinone biosynthesis C-methylase UbiE